MRKSALAALAAAGILAFGAPAGAATVSLDQTVDLNGVSQVGGRYSFGPEDFAPLSVTLGLGDVLDWTIHFQPGQTLTLLNANRVDAELGPHFDVDTISQNATMNFFDADGGAFNSVTTVMTRVAGFGSFFASEAGHAGLITISGMHFLIPLTMFRPAANVTPETFDAVYQVVITDNGLPPSAVPEPAGWALLIGGFSLAGAALRRRRGQLA